MEGRFQGEGFRFQEVPDRRLAACDTAKRLMRSSFPNHFDHVLTVTNCNLGLTENFKAGIEARASIPAVVFKLV
jgi:hypothetical protein